MKRGMPRMYAGQTQSVYPVASVMTHATAGVFQKMGACAQNPLIIAKRFATDVVHPWYHPAARFLPVIVRTNNVGQTLVANRQPFLHRARTEAIRAFNAYPMTPICVSGIFSAVHLSHKSASKIVKSAVIWPPWPAGTT